MTRILQFGWGLDDAERRPRFRRRGSSEAAANPDVAPSLLAASSTSNQQMGDPSVSQWVGTISGARPRVGRSDSDDDLASHLACRQGLDGLGNLLE